MLLCQSKVYDSERAVARAGRYLRLTERRGGRGATWISAEYC